MEVAQIEFLTLLLTIFTSPISSTKKGHTCGRPIGSEFALENDRIVAGYDVGYYRYPWYAALIRNGQVGCGAALIGSRTILTAAHCYKEFLDLSGQGALKLEEIYTVKLGVYNVCSTVEKSQREYKVQKVQVHELYLTKKPYYDICLITLANDTAEYEPICMPETDVAKKPKDGTVPGLGTLRYHGALPCTVHEARILIYSDQECKDMINKTGNNATALAKAFCAGYLQGGIDTCQGDSGGPLQVFNEGGDFVLLGLVSFGFHCAMPGVLGMYTDVSQFIDWVKEKSGLDPQVIHLPKTTSPDSELTESPLAPKPPKKRPHRPYWRPIQIIIYRNKRPIVVKKLVLHRPIVRDD